MKYRITKQSSLWTVYRPGGLEMGRFHSWRLAFVAAMLSARRCEYRETI